VSTFRPLPSFDSSYYGTTAINATRPTNPVADLAVNLAEFKSEGARLNVHTDYGSIRKSADNIGDDWLNSQFGWLPLAGAIRDTAKAVRNSSEIVAQLQRDAGKLVHRRYSFPLEVLENTVYVPKTGKLNLPVTDAQCYQIFSGGVRTGSMLQEVQTSRSVRFSGAYTYHLNVGDDLLSRLDRYEQYSNKLLGTRLTPEVAWNLMPWSWLADWHWDIGKIISNATALGDDSLVLVYGYLTEWTTVRHRVTITGPSLISGRKGPFTTQFTTLRKQRVQASPYGFSTTPGSFTARQWSILGALGLTKAPNALR